MFDTDKPMKKPIGSFSNTGTCSRKNTYVVTSYINLIMDSKDIVFFLIFSVCCYFQTLYLLNLFYFFLMLINVILNRGNFLHSSLNKVTFEFTRYRSFLYSTRRL